MSRGKGQQTSGGTKKEKKETRQERRARLEAEAAAREQCLKILPYVGGFILVLIMAFGLWVRSVPPKVVTKPEFKITPEMLQQQQVQQGFQEDVMAAAANAAVKQAVEDGAPIKVDSEVKAEDIIVDTDAGDAAGGDEDVTEL